MDKNWLDNELTFDDLDVDLAQEEIFMHREEAEFDDFPYIKELDPDATYINAVASGDHVHKMPASSRRKSETLLEPILAAAMNNRFRLACFSQAYLGYGVGDFSETGYLKAVIENNKIKADIIKEVTDVSGDVGL